MPVWAASAIKTRNRESGPGKLHRPNSRRHHGLSSVLGLDASSAGPDSLGTLISVPQLPTSYRSERVASRGHNPRLALRAVKNHPPPPGLLANSPVNDPVRFTLWFRDDPPASRPTSLASRWLPLPVTAGRRPCRIRVNGKPATASCGPGLNGYGPTSRTSRWPNASISCSMQSPLYGQANGSKSRYPRSFGSMPMSSSPAVP